MTLPASLLLLVRAAAAVLLLLAGGCGCSPQPPRTTLALEPDPNPLGPGDPRFTPQPHRDRPRAICVSPDGTRGWVMLGGIEDDPGEEIAVVDLVAGEVIARRRLGRSPWGCALDPSGRFLVVTLRYANFAVVLDAATSAEVARVDVPFYTENALFSADGRRLFLTNRWKDSVLAWDVALTDGFRLLRTSYEGIPPEDPMGTPVGENPGPLALSADGTRLFVGAVAGVSTSVLDTESLAELDVDSDPRTTTLGAPPGITRLAFNSPVGGLAVWGNYLVIADTGRGTGSVAAEGLDLDDDGLAGDGTANVVFQDLQNELGVVDTGTLREVYRATSDSICCADFRDVDPELPERGRLLPEPDPWQPELLAYLPPKSRWIVAGALPEAMVVQGDVLWVAYSGSNEVQGFGLSADGHLEPLQRAGSLLRTGFNPKALALAGSKLVSVDRLGESLTILDPAGGPSRTVIVGDVSGGAFPATDAELGEGINEMTAIFSIDGDQTCVHCHRDNGAIARPIVMPLQENREWGARNVPAQRGLYDTRPWFFESAMLEDNFFPVLNEFARKENFCCEQLDPTVWSLYPTASECLADEGLEGCNHVLHCTEDPPPECAERPYALGTELRRAEFIKVRARRLFGRDQTFGDVVGDPGPGGTLLPRPLDFEGITRAVGLFMLRTPRLLPNPNRRLDLPSARRGQALFQDRSVGCAACHPLPLTTTATLPLFFSPSGMPIRFPPVISPSRAPDGSDASRVTDGFIGTFPQTVQGPQGLHVGATPLRGLWDRPQTRFFHDGRARSLKEALATPGHSALRPGETGHNERDGVFDTHGGTSQLDRYQLQDLANFLETL